MHTQLLKGKTFISTRPAGKSEELKELFHQHGASLVEMPMIEIQAAQLSVAEKELLENTGQFNWIIFTSSNGISSFFAHLREITGSYTLSPATRIAVIGKKTGAELAIYGHQPSYINKGTTGEDFAAELAELFGNTLPNVLLPVGNLAREVIETKLESIAKVTRITVYITLMPDITRTDALDRIATDNYDMILFTSPSGFHNFNQITENKINTNRLKIVCIGNTTAQAVARQGIKPLVVAHTMDSQGIVEAILDYYK